MPESLSSSAPTSSAVPRGGVRKGGRVPGALGSRPARRMQDRVAAQQGRVPGVDSSHQGLHENLECLLSEPADHEGRHGLIVTTGPCRHRGLLLDASFARFREQGAHGERGRIHGHHAREAFRQGMQGVAVHDK